LSFAGSNLDEKRERTGDMYMEAEQLIKAAIEAKEHAYAPYSNFRVGAALLTKGGKVYQGCNIENAAYSPTNCAERTAFFKAVYEGEREFEAIAINGDGDDYLFPCGVCRQVMAEFCDPDTFLIYVSKKNGAYQKYTLAELFPGAFTKDDIDKARVY
jgi:cytidine deaminase